MARSNVRIAITQSNYVPWRGWFAVARDVDRLILLDDVQFTRRDWRNRNQITLGGSTRWLTVPVESRDHYNQLICETRISDPNWWQSHLSTLQHSLRNHNYFRDVEHRLGDIYRRLAGVQLLSEINRLLIEFVFEIIEIDTPLLDSRSFDTPQHRSERLLHICQTVGATTYVSGPAARDYLDEEAFLRSSVSVEWVDYSRLPTPSLAADQGDFSILDTIARFGTAEARRLSTFDS